MIRNHEPERFSHLTALLAAAIAFSINLELNYALSYWTCSTKRSWVHHIVGLATLAVAVSASAYGLTTRNKGQSNLERFIGGFVAAVSLIFALAIIAQWGAVFVFDPCDR